MSALLLLHGFTGAPSSFDTLVSELPGALRVLRPFTCGHGVPPAGAGVNTFTEEVERLAALLDAEESAVVAGYSLGARLALGLALAHPSRVRALVLVSGSPGLRSEAERAARRDRDEHLARVLEREGLEAFVDLWEKEPLFATQSALPEAVRSAERARRLGHTASGLAQALRTTGLGQMPDYWPLLGSLRGPVELLAGGLDPRFCALATAVVGELSAGRFTAVPGAGHNLLLERPLSVAEAIVRGLSS
jgi:2-succinyl-6-hydroxy-2,4-cyclohexadiene-1-carboxylate synthase